MLLPTACFEIFPADRNFSIRYFPAKVDPGSTKPATFEWLLGRTKDGTQTNAPREIIHVLEELRAEQISRLERRENVPPNGLLFDRSVFKQALVPVSVARLQQTLYAEYPELKKYTDALKSEKSSQNLQSLSALWECNQEEAREIANHLVSVGFLAAQGNKQKPIFWIPFLYREPLDIVQGSA